jgi:hypothetical protein
LPPNARLGVGVPGGPSTDPLLAEKVVGVVGLHHDPPDKAVVLCADEKSQVQALDRSQPVRPIMPGMPERICRRFQAEHTRLSRGNIGDASSAGRAIMAAEIPVPPVLKFLTPGELARDYFLVGGLFG